MRERIILIAVALILVLNGCGYKEVTRIFPVKDFITTENGAITTFEMDGETHSFDFKEEYIYPCEETSRIIGVGHVNDKETIGRYSLYLYLSAKDYAMYIRDKYNLSEDFLKEKEEKE